VSTQIIIIVMNDIAQLSLVLRIWRCPTNSTWRLPETSICLSIYLSLLRTVSYKSLIMNAIQTGGDWSGYVRTKSADRRRRLVIRQSRSSSQRWTMISGSNHATPSSSNISSCSGAAVRQTRANSLPHGDSSLQTTRVYASRFV